MMTEDVVLKRLLVCLEIDDSDYTEDATIGSFYAEEDLDDLKQNIGDAFDIDVDSMDLDTTIAEMVTTITAHING